MAAKWKKTERRVDLIYKNHFLMKDFNFPFWTKHCANLEAAIGTKTSFISPLPEKSYLPAVAVRVILYATWQEFPLQMISAESGETSTTSGELRPKSEGVA
ncbi:hypothetical protein CDAR_557751 [Caerostris darwini]|uniref:Uncharacterized protein n=1 Tax=Caerostris darwini TaxID=1538125 RepID=A0AAV4TMD2_9ARAC|nr:hypothetical protein CDAR_557751 [Caerostris darwini]